MEKSSKLRKALTASTPTRETPGRRTATNKEQEDHGRKEDKIQEKIFIYLFY